MEKYDSEMAARVWKRVNGEAEQAAAPAPSAQALAAAELEQAAMLLGLSGQFQGKNKALLRRLYEEEKAHGAMLRGIQLLTAGKCPAVKPAPARQTTPEIALCKCYAAALRAMKEYESRISDPEYGPVFVQLARQESVHCACILEILGSMAGF